MTETATATIEQPVQQEHYFDERILDQLDVGQEHIAITNGSTPIVNKELGFYGVVSENIADDQSGGDIARELKAIMSDFVATDFDPDDPINSMKVIVRKANEHLREKIDNGELPNTPTSATFVKFYQHEGKLTAACANVGNNRLIHHSAIKDSTSSLVKAEEVEDQDGTIQLANSITSNSFVPQQVGILDLAPRDRLIISNRDTFIAQGSKAVYKDDARKAVEDGTAETSARKLARLTGKVEKSIAVVDVYSRRRTIWNRALATLGLVDVEFVDQPGEQRPRRIANLSQRPGAWVGSWRANRAYQREAAGATAISETSQEKEKRGPRWLLIGATAVGAVAALYLLQKATGYGNTKGVDLWPTFGKHGDGLDLNPWNRSSFLSDDPVRHFATGKKQGLDIIPTWMGDSDGIDLNPFNYGPFNDDSHRHALSVVPHVTPKPKHVPPVVDHSKAPTAPPKTTPPAHHNPTPTPECQCLVC